MLKNKYWIAFSSIESIDSAFILRLFHYFGDIETAYRANEREFQNIDGLSVKKAENFIAARKNIDIEKVFAEVENRGIKFLTFADENYPFMLKQIYNPPAVLYYKGDLSRINFNKTLAVVGSRRASTYAKDALKLVLKDLQNTDITIVSGLASGIDTTAHNIAIENGLKTIGVIASGFDYTYPAGNKSLYEAIEKEHGVIFTEYYPTFEPMKFRFPQRNRIVSGLSYGTVVAEASLKSGALITANLTLEQGRDLMCIPGLITNPNTQGIYRLLKNGASLVTCTEDILSVLGWEVEQQQQLNLASTLYLNIEEAKVLSFLEVEEKNFDELQQCTKMDIETLLTNLTLLELKGIIKKVDGDRYKREV
ncbi:MAG: DNA-processing protein DprA [Fusobacterium sp.]|nr:DNA-processing protein DprA [Fusobacterium sp.]